MISIEAMFVFFPYKLQLGDACLLEIENRLTCKANVGLNTFFSFALLTPRGWSEKGLSIGI